MRSVFFTILLILSLPMLESCGNDSDNENSYSENERSRKGRCRDYRASTKGTDWKIFVDNVKDLNFVEFAEFSGWTGCTEYHHAVKGSNCKMKGIFYICDGTTYSKPDGSDACSSGTAHETDLINLVTPVPVNFEAEFCGDKMVRAQIAVSGKGDKPDVYRFDFEKPVQYNPVWKLVWKDADRRYRTSVRQ